MTRLLVFIIIGFLFSSLVHELGHLIMGLFRGWTFNSIIFGPFRIEAEQHTRKIRVMFEKDIKLWGGLASTIPNKDGQQGMKDFGHILLAGPWLSVIFGVVFLVLYIEFDFLLILAIAGESLGMGIVSLLPFPMRTGLVFTDGYRYLRIKKGGKSLLEEEAVFVLSTLEVFNKKVTFSEAENLARPLIESEDKIYKYYALHYLYHLARKLGSEDHMDRMSTMLVEASQHVSKNIRAILPIDE